MPYADATIASGSYADVAFSADGTRIYAATGNHVDVINIATGQVVNTFTFGTQLSAIDLSPDGRYLAVVDRQPASGQGAYYQIDLNDNSVAGYNIPAIGPFFDVEYVIDDNPYWPNGYLAMMEASTGRLYMVDIDTGAYSYGIQYDAGTPFVGSADGSYFAIMPPGRNWPVNSLDVNDGTGRVYYGYPDPYAGASVPPSSNGIGAVSPDGSLIIFGMSLQVLNSNLAPLFTLATMYPYLAQPVGLAFSPDGSRLYLLDDTRQLVVFDTSTWFVLGAYRISGTNVSNPGAFAGEILLVSDNGRYVSVMGSDGIHLVDTSTASMFATDGSDNLSGTGQIFGYGGSDTLTGGAGFASLFGGEGNDTYIVSSWDHYVWELPGQGTDRIVASLSFSLPDNVENLSLSGSENIDGYGNDSDNVIAGNGGNNILEGFKGSDWLKGLGGDDVLVGGLGNDIIDGGSGTDTASYSSAYSGVLIDLASGTAAPLLLAEDDSGTDSLVSIENIVGGYGSDQLFGDDSSNTIEGGQGADLIDGRGGNDLLDGGYGADQMSGGLGNDIFIVDNVGDVATEAAGQGTDEVRSSVGYTLGANLENLLLTGSAGINGTGNTLANIITGNGGNNVLTGLAGDDILRGGLGNDTLDGGVGVDKMYGGVGDDTYIVSDATDYTYEYAGEGTDLVLASVTTRLRDFVENLTLTGSGNIYGTGNDLANVITGNAGSNRLYGLDGDDTLYGLAGNDTLYGGVGTDHLYGGIGNDVYSVGDAGDIVHENGGEGTDTVYSFITYTLTANVERLYLVGSEAIDATGNSGANILKGNEADNVLSGGDGNDLLYGYGGNDTLVGGAGVDKMYGREGDDTYIVSDSTDFAYEAAGQGTDTVLASVTCVLRDHVEVLTLTGTDAINGYGNGQANILTGNDAANLLAARAGDDQLSGLGGDDILYGEDGNDLIAGGAGRDRAYGGSGSDTFIFADGDFGGADAATADIIHDFSQSEGDHIDLSAVDANTGLGGNQAFSFIGSAAFGNVAGQLRTEVISGNTYVMGDTDGDGTADFWIRLDGLHTLSGGDFIL